jgi:glycosyltransferase involved in cell wall biosynthesis
MNVMFLNAIEKNTFGGMEMWIACLADGLIKRGHKVVITGRRESEFLRRAVKINGNIVPEGIKISGDFNPVTIHKIKALLKEHAIDILVTNFNKDVRLGGTAARWRGKGKVVWSLGVDLTKNTFRHRFLTPRLIDGVISPSRWLKESVLSKKYIREELIEIIPVGIPALNMTASKNEVRTKIRQQYNMTPGSLVAVVSGRLVPEKGHATLLEAASEIVNKYPKLVFLILGDGFLRNELEEKVRELKLEKHFVFAGALDEVEEELAASDLMVHPSFQDNFPLAVLEGMRAGLPVVATRVGGIPEEVVENKTGLLVAPNDAKALSAAVISLLESEEKRQALGRAGYERWQQQFKLETMVDRVENYFNTLLN